MLQLLTFQDEQDEQDDLLYDSDELEQMEILVLLELQLLSINKLVNDNHYHILILTITF